MISLGSTLSPAHEAGVVYTKSRMVELVLDLAGYLPENRLVELVALEPSAGDGAFLSAMARRLVESWGARLILKIPGAGGTLHSGQFPHRNFQSSRSLNFRLTTNPQTVQMTA